MRITPVLPVFLPFILLVHAEAATISVNFVDVVGVDSMAPSDLAGAPGAGTRVTNWNNIQAAANGAAAGLVYDSGAASATAVSFASDLGTWRNGFAAADGDSKMWKGYLDTANSTTVNVSGLSFVGSYDVVIYFDGDNGGQWRVGNYTIGATTLGGEDSENTNWGSGQNTGLVYQVPLAGSGGNASWPISPNNGEGNYVRFTGITGSSFTITAGGGASSDIPRAPINGFQIVGTVPEPATGILGLGALGLGLRRRRRA